MPDASQQSSPSGTLSLQTLAMPGYANPNGDIFGGWVLSQMDIATSIHARRIAGGRCATVAISNMVFLKPVSVGDTVSCYTQLTRSGRTSMNFTVEVWCTEADNDKAFKVTEGEFVFVAIDDQGKSRPLAK